MHYHSQEIQLPTGGSNSVSAYTDGIRWENSIYGEEQGREASELVNKSELEIEQTGWVSDETEDLLIAAELDLTEDDINEIEAEYNSAAREQAEQESYIQS